MDVRLERRAVADHEQRVAELVELAFDVCGIEAFALDHERRAVAEAGELLVDGLLREGGGLRGFGQLLSPGGGRHPAQDLDQAGRARVHNSGSAEDIELLLRLGDRLVAAADESFEQIRRVEGGGSLRFGLVGELADDREHRAFDRLAEGLVGRVRGAAEGSGDRGGVDLTGRGELIRSAADDLRQDHAGVPAGAQKRSPARLACEIVPVVRVRPGERLLNAAHCQQQVRAGVAVGHRVDVEVVDPLPAPLERPDGATDEQAQRFEVAHGLKVTLLSHPRHTRVRLSWLRSQRGGGWVCLKQRRWAPATRSPSRPGRSSGSACRRTPALPSRRGERERAGGSG